MGEPWQQGLERLEEKWTTEVLSIPPAWRSVEREGEQQESRFSAPSGQRIPAWWPITGAAAGKRC